MSSIMNAMNGAEGEYRTDSQGPITARPVVAEDTVIGYLWFAHAPQEHAAGFIAVPGSAVATARATEVWETRLREAARNGISPEQAVLDWIGVPADQEAGAIPAGSSTWEAENTGALSRELLAGFQGRGDEETRVPGPPVFDRWSDEALSPVLVGRTYTSVTDGPVLYVPVTMGYVLIGYLWASEADDAADFQPLLPPDIEANIARGWWIMEHVRLHGEGLTPLEALRSCVGTVDDRHGGRVDADATESRAESLAKLRDIARR